MAEHVRRSNGFWSGYTIKPDVINAFEQITWVPFPQFLKAVSKKARAECSIGTCDFEAAQKDYGELDTGEVIDVVMECSGVCSRLNSSETGGELASVVVREALATSRSAVDLAAQAKEIIEQE